MFMFELLYSFEMVIELGFNVINLDRFIFDLSLFLIDDWLFVVDELVVDEKLRFIYCGIGDLFKFELVLFDGGVVFGNNCVELMVEGLDLLLWFLFVDKRVV